MAIVQGLSNVQLEIRRGFGMTRDGMAPLSEIRAGLEEWQKDWEGETDEDQRLALKQHRLLEYQNQQLEAARDIDTKLPEGRASDVVGASQKEGNEDEGGSSGLLATGAAGVLGGLAAKLGLGTLAAAVASATVPLALGALAAGGAWVGARRLRDWLGTTGPDDPEARDENMWGLDGASAGTVDPTIERREGGSWWHQGLAGDIRDWVLNSDPSEMEGDIREGVDSNEALAESARNAAAEFGYVQESHV